MEVGLDAVDRTTSTFQYFGDDGFPDLVYSSGTSVYVCPYCDVMDECVRCFGSGYLFIDATRYDCFVKEAYQDKIKRWSAFILSYNKGLESKTLVHAALHTFALACLLVKFDGDRACLFRLIMAAIIY